MIPPSMKTAFRKSLALAAGLSLAALTFACPGLRAADSAHWKVASAPTMGWNSYDAFGSSVTENEFLANAAYVKERLLPHGWNYVVVDFRWSDATAANYNPNGHAGLPLEMDAHGRLLPAPERFPSAAGGKGFKPLADKVHAMGLKFGIHLMRGIPRNAVAANTPIEGSQFHAADAADIKSKCSWCADMWGVNARTQASHVAANANMWRVSADFWDNWKSLRHGFELAAKWQAHIGPGHWPDSDMIPFGKVGIRCVGKPRMSRFTRDEQFALMSLWCIVRSPLMLGGNLPENDEFNLSLLTNDEVLAVNQQSANNRQLFNKENGVAWIADVPGSASKFLAVFNLQDEKDAKSPAKIAVALPELGIEKPCTVRDLWQHKEMGAVAGEFAPEIPNHGAGLFRLTPIP